MFNLFSDKPVVGKASSVIRRSDEYVFNFIGIDLLVNYPRGSPEVRELVKLTEGPLG